MERPKIDSEELEVKKKIWNRCTAAVNKTIDGLAEPVEDGIKETVIAIKANGFGTFASCEGHRDRGIPYPWVDVGSILAEENNKFGSRFHKLKKAYLGEIRGEGTMSDSDRAEFQEMVEAERVADEEAFIKLSAILDEFYQAAGIESPTLVINKGPRNSGRLMPVNVIGGNLKNIREELSRMTPEEIEDNLKQYRASMNQFADYLKSRFFA